MMNKFSYQILRSDVESAIADYDPCKSSPDVLVNCVMRLFLQAVSAEQVRSQKLKRDFATFRRSENSIPPSWAYRKPSISDRLPTL